VLRELTLLSFGDMMDDMRIAGIPGFSAISGAHGGPPATHQDCIKLDIDGKSTCPRLICKPWVVAGYVSALT
jgi:hypothetical protein